MCRDMKTHASTKYSCMHTKMIQNYTLVQKSSCTSFQKQSPTEMHKNRDYTKMLMAIAMSLIQYIQEISIE